CPRSGRASGTRSAWSSTTRRERQRRGVSGSGSGEQAYTLLGADGRPDQSASKGRWGGHRRAKIYGRLDCPSALRAIARGGYAGYRVFFADEETAVAAGQPPCRT